MLILNAAISFLIVFICLYFSSNKDENTNSVENTTIIETTEEITEEVTEQETTEAETTVPLKKEMLLKTDDELGYVFNLTFEEFIESYNNAVDELEFYNISYINTFDFEELMFAEDDFFCQHSDGINLYLDKNSNKIFEIFLSNETSMEELKTTICLIIKSINPEFIKEDVQSCYTQLVNSEESFSQDSGETTVNYLYLNNILYELCQSDGWYSANISPCTDDYYQQQLDNARTNSTSDNSDSSYIVEDFGQFYADVPNNWIYEVRDEGIYFYEEYNYTNDEIGSTGFLCRISGIEPQNSDTLSPNSRYIGGTGKIDYYVELPTGVGIIEDETASQKMKIAYSQVEDFIDSIRFK